jgi:uridylate kinase
LKYRRVLLKLSGEAFGRTGLTEGALAYLTEELQAARALGVELAVVVGGGNLVRGSSLKFLDRAVADRMGMLATLINGLALQAALARRKIPVLLQSAVAAAWADPIQPERAREALANGHIVIFAGGTGNPFVTTDTAAAIRALEVEAEVLLKATQVEGVYTADPKRDPNAELLRSLTFERAIKERLGVMDLAALALCQEHRLPIVVFDFFKKGNLGQVLRGEEIGTRVSL